MVTHPKGIKSPVHPFENWKIHPEDFVGNVSPTNSLCCPKTQCLPMVNTVSFVQFKNENIPLKFKNFYYK